MSARTQLQSKPVADLRSATGFDCNCDLADILSPI